MKLYRTLYWGNIGILEKKMETTGIVGVSGLFTATTTVVAKLLTGPLIN